MSPPGLQDFAGTPDVMVHCAGSGSVAYSLSDPLSDFDRTVTTTATVLDYVRRRSPQTVVVYPSSASVYGVAKVLPISEDSATAPISPYGLHKWMAEQLVISYSTHYSVCASIVRLFSVYGCGLRKQLLWDGCRKLMAGDRVFMGTGGEVRDWLHIDDAADLLRVASEHATSQCPISNGGTGEGVCVREVLEHLANCLIVGGELPSFTDAQRPGDPSVYIADTTRAAQWGWKPSEHWRVRVAEYAAWWKLEMGLER